MEKTPFYAFCHYIAIKNHFTLKSYDAIKYNFKTNIKYSTFEKRNDKYFFNKLAKHSDLTKFLVSLFIINPTIWAGDIVSNYAEATIVYNHWLARQQKLKYLFQADCRKLDLVSCLKCTNNNHPEAFKKVLGGDISIETITILTDLTGALEPLERKLKGDIIFEQYSLVFKKYRPFLLYDRKEYARMLALIVNEQVNKVA